MLRMLERIGLGQRPAPRRFLHIFQGRLAALNGDTAGAIIAYRHYLGLRSNPEPTVRPEVEQVRSELAGLIEEPK